MRERHLPGSDDGVGEDPLGPLVGGTASTSSGHNREMPGELSNDGPFRERQDRASFAEEARAGPVRLELGMDAEVLDKILDEIEVRESELSEVRFVRSSSFSFSCRSSSVHSGICSFWLFSTTLHFLPWRFGFPSYAYLKPTTFTNPVVFFVWLKSFKVPLARDHGKRRVPW